MAWSPVVEQKMALKAAALAPPDLSLLIERHRRDFQLGVDRGASECPLKHQYSTSGKQNALRAQIASETSFAVHMMRTRKPINEFVQRLGQVAHLIGDANNPFLNTSAEPDFRRLQSDFEAYLERRLPVIPTVFYGLQDPLPLGRYLDQSFLRTSRYAPLIREEYAGGGEPQTSADFDDRSTAFGVISLAYSHAVTDLINVYYHVWREAGGDVRSAAAMRRGTLLLNPSPLEQTPTGGER